MCTNEDGSPDLNAWEDVKIDGLENEDINTLLNTKTYAQYVQYVKDQQNGVCPFCEPLDSNLNRVIEQITIPDGDTEASWRMWENPFPVKHSERHLVIAPKRHIIHPDHMTSGDWDCLSYLFAFAISVQEGQSIGLPGGGILLRWGDPSLNAGSIRHIHANIVVPDGTGEIKLTLAKDPEKVEQKKKVVMAFEKMRRLGEKYPDKEPEELANMLPDNELALVVDRLK